MSRASQSLKTIRTLGLLRPSSIKDTYEADPAVLDALPDTITAALTRGERIALAWSLKKQAPVLPTGKDAIELGAAIFGPLMGEVLRDIAFPLARRVATA